LSFSNINEVRTRIEAMESRLDNRQRLAAESILENPIQEDGFLLPIIDGPPGTGKTTVGVHASIRAILEGRIGGVIYVAPTNFAAMQAKYTFQKYVPDPRDVIWLNPRSSQKSWDEGIVGVRWDLSDLGLDEMRRLRRAPIIICTPYMLGRIKRGYLRSSNIKVIIDEFSQIDPALFFMIVSQTGANTDRYVRGGYALLGDPLQLPVVTTQQELMENIAEFLISYRTIDGGFNALILQHRMHEEICNAVNRMRQELSFWHGFTPLEPSANVRYRDLRELGYEYAEQRVQDGQLLDSEMLREILDPSHTFVVINTDRLSGDSKEIRTKSGSLRNIAEAKAAVDIAIATYQSYYQPQGTRLMPHIISPYNAQVNEIRERLRRSISHNIEDHVITAYSSQGREYPMVILSLVRNNPARKIGFLEDEKLRAQVYVACSRAMAKLVVLLSKNTFGGKPLYEELVRAENSRHALILGWD
jgi:ATP-dependent exoDNAse (exonuclease V) alpha subunit